MKKVSVFIPATLGMLTAFGPFVTDFYLPVLPEMAAYFRTSPSLISMSLTTGMIGLAAGQIFIGPLTDKYGRKGILLGSMTLFVLASLLCIFSVNIFMFNAARLLQGIAGAGGIVISKSMATDMNSGEKLVRFMAVLAAINGVATVFAPLIGGAMSGITDWKGIFSLLMALGLVLLVCSALLKETLAPESRIAKNLAGTYLNLFRVFGNKTFTICTAAQMFCHFTLFAYISSSPFILQQLYGLSPLQFSLCLAGNSFALAIGSIVGPRLGNVSKGISCGAWCLAVCSLCSGLCLLAHAPLAVVIALYACTLLGFGATQPGLLSTALDCERKNAGAASAIYSAAGFVAGSIVSPIVTIGRIEVTSSLVMVLGGVGCLLLTLPLREIFRKAGR